MAFKSSKKDDERGFKYKKRSKDSLKERANMKGGNFDTYIKPKFKQWKPKDGKNLIRILPPTFDLADAPWQNTEHYGMDIHVNFNIGPDNQSYLSLSKHLKGADPLADARRDAQKDGEKDLAKALNPNTRILYWIIDRNDEDEGPLLWAAPFTFDKSLANLCIDEDTKEVTAIDDPETGHDVRFYKEGTGLTTKYDPSKMKVLGESVIHEDEGQEKEWLDFIYDNPLTDVLNFYDAGHISAAFDGVAGRKDDDDEKPARSRKSRDEDEDEKPKARARSRAAEAEDEPPPRRGPRRDEEDGEEDEKPKARSRAKPADDEEKPTTRSRSRREEPDEEEDEAPPTNSRHGKSSDTEEGGGGLRERIARRRSRDSDED
jgi:hypothetical protein